MWTLDDVDLKKESGLLTFVFFNRYRWAPIKSRKIVYNPPK